MFEQFSNMRTAIHVGVLRFHEWVTTSVNQAVKIEKNILALEYRMLDITKATVAEIGRIEKNLHTRVDCLETHYLNPVVLELRTAVSELREENAKLRAELRSENDALRSELQEAKTELTTELTSHLEAIRHINMTARKVPNIIGGTPTLLQ